MLVRPAPRGHIGVAARPAPARSRQADDGHAGICPAVASGQSALFREAAGHHPVRELRDVARPVDMVLHGPEQQCLHFKIVSVFYWHPVSTEIRMLLIPRVRLGATYLLGRWDP